MLLRTQALVLSTYDRSESDRILTVLTRENGKMAVYARGCKKLNSHLMSASQKFYYGTCTVKTGPKFNYLCEAEPEESFPGLRSSIEALALGTYVAEVVEDVSVENQPEIELLDLALNTLYLISLGKKRLELIKAAFEMRCCVILGYQPDLEGCRQCGKADADFYYLDVMNGNIICGDCVSKLNSEKKEQPAVTPDGTAVIIVGMDASATAAMRHIVYGAPEKAFSFNIKGDSGKQLFTAAEKYLQNQLEKSFSSLDFYKSLLINPETT